MCLLEGGERRARGKEGGDRLGWKLEDEASLGNVAQVVVVETGDCVIEVDGVEKGDGSAGFDEADGLLGLTTCHEDDEHGDHGGGALHAGVTVDKEGAAGVVFGGHSVDGLKGPQLCVSDFLGLEIVVQWNSVECHRRVQDKGNVFGTVEDCLDAVSLEPVAAGGGLEVAEPDTSDDFVGPCRGVRVLVGIHYRSIFEVVNLIELEENNL